jgi:twitching motility two-component system response regulator PilG
MSNRVFKLAIFGFSETERRVMGSVIKLAEGRGRFYELVDEGSQLADIAIVDWDCQGTLHQWSQQNNMAALAVASDPDSIGHDHIAIRRPLTVKRLLDGLNQVSLRDFRYMPELAVHDDSTVEAAAGSLMKAAAQVARIAVRTGVKALVVDDSAAVRKIMDIQLGLHGFDSDFAETGEAALELLAENNYDVVFLDLTLPQMNGYDVCKAIKRSPRNRDVKVVILTGRGSRIDRIRGAMAGCDAYLTKPVAQEELHQTITQLFPTESNHVHQ